MNLKEFKPKIYLMKFISKYYNKLQKTLFQNSFIWKSFFEKKDKQSFCKVIMLTHCISFTLKHVIINYVKYTHFQQWKFEIKRCGLVN
jgi:hypothetical protein